MENDGAVVRRADRMHQLLRMLREAESDEAGQPARPERRVLRSPARGP